MLCCEAMDGAKNSTGDLEMIGMICEAMDGAKNSTGDLETIGMICKSYGWSVKRYM